jgi:hypothetical protein
VYATQAGQTRALPVSSDVYFRDRCHSGEGARIQATLKEGTQLTLDENATLVVDKFVYDPYRAMSGRSVAVVPLLQRSARLRFWSSLVPVRLEEKPLSAGFPAGQYFNSRVTPPRGERPDGEQ